MSHDTWVYEQVALRLSNLIEDVYDVSIDRDENRQLLTSASAGQEMERPIPRALYLTALYVFWPSRFLALDPTSQGCQLP